MYTKARINAQEQYLARLRELDMDIRSAEHSVRTSSMDTWDAAMDMLFDSQEAHRILISALRAEARHI